MITELYRDKGEIDKDGVKIPYVNHVHEWWVRFDNGATRPATETELELWFKYTAERDQAQYPQKSGDTLVLGPGCIMSEDRRVINYEGATYFLPHEGQDKPA